MQEGYKMSRENVINSPAFKKMITLGLSKFETNLTISEDQKALCLNGQAIIAKDTSVFTDGALFQGIGAEVLKRIEIESYENGQIGLAEKLCSRIGFFIFKHHLLTQQEFTTQVFSGLNETEQSELIKAADFVQANTRFFGYLEHFIYDAIGKYLIERTDLSAIQVWFKNAINQDFLKIIEKGLRFNKIEDLYQYFEIAQAKNVITVFLAKHPQMADMLRPIWEAHTADPERKIFSQLKTIKDMERGDFLVEKYNQEYSYYNWSACSQKFLADGKSWQWLLTQPQKTIDIITKLYAVNDKELNKFAYHSFGRTRENLSLVAHLNLETKLAQVFLKDLVSDSLESDRFAIFINRGEKELLNPDFHSGQKYRDAVAKVFAYMDSKNMNLDTRIKFLKTFSAPINKIAVNVWYEKKYKNSELTENQIIDHWVSKKISELKKITKNTYLPERINAA